MKLGIDFGTTRIIVAYVDRGNYPIVSYNCPDGVDRDWFPPLVAVKGGKRVYAWDAWAAQEEPGWTVVRSLKRALEGAGPESLVQIGTEIVPMMQLLTELCSSLRTNLLGHSNLPETNDGELEVMLGVPANANSNQRFLTAEAFRLAGFKVMGLLNEPSAASIEFGHRERHGRHKDGECHILVYDLGGGTFDASLVSIAEQEQRVIASEGIGSLGGDDFDELLAELALDAAGISALERDDLPQAEMFHLYEESRNHKEHLHPNTRNITIDLGVVREGWPQVSLPIHQFYDRCKPLVQETLNATEDLLEANGYDSVGTTKTSGSGANLEALYVTGGGSELPIVGRMLRETFGRRVRRSAYTRSATAIGLAIQADSQTGYVLRDKFTRHFGVWRESDGGRSIVFDPLFTKGTPLPSPGEAPLLQLREYTPAHNIGHFRYLECSDLTDAGRPAGNITAWDDIRFAFDPTLHQLSDLRNIAVSHLDPTVRLHAEEHYTCDAGGTVKVTITDITQDYTRSYRLGRWSAGEKRVVPGRKKKTSSRKA